MNPEEIIQMITDFFTSVPWEDVIDSFVSSFEGVQWDVLGDTLGEIFDFSSPDSAFQKFLDILSSLFFG